MFSKPHDHLRGLKLTKGNNTSWPCCQDAIAANTHIAAHMVATATEHMAQAPAARVPGQGGQTLGPLVPAPRQQAAFCPKGGLSL